MKLDVQSTRIGVADDFFNEEDHQRLLNYCYDADYSWGETDDDDDESDAAPTGMVHNIPETSEIYALLKSKILKTLPRYSKQNIYRMYINCFAPNEYPLFHTDVDEFPVPVATTFLYYPQENWELNDGGETQFYIDGNIRGIVPKSNRMIMFDSRLKHRATSFRNRHRFTIAIKFTIPELKFY